MTITSTALVPQPHAARRADEQAGHRPHIGWLRRLSPRLASGGKRS
ncbi:MAG TPA: hypothetical protein VMT46_17725 [Anaerolineaceae bacterium]|nr:hypothetical protein [Anaerolineaceae bacterium]